MYRNFEYCVIMAWMIAIYRQYIDLLLLPSSHMLPMSGGVLSVLLIGKDSMRSSDEASVVTLFRQTSHRLLNCVVQQMKDCQPDPL